LGQLDYALARWAKRLVRTRHQPFGIRRIRHTLAHQPPSIHILMPLQSARRVRRSRCNTCGAPRSPLPALRCRRCRRLFSACGSARTWVAAGS